MNKIAKKKIVLAVVRRLVNVAGRLLVAVLIDITVTRMGLSWPWAVAAGWAMGEVLQWAIGGT